MERPSIPNDSPSPPPPLSPSAQSAGAAEGETRRGREGEPHGALLRRLLDRGWEFSFFQAVWLLERCWTQLLPVGGRGPAAREGLRFRPDVGLGFPSTDVRRIAEVKHPESGTPLHRVDVTFLGLYGVATPLPLHYAIRVLRAVDREALSMAHAEAPHRHADPAAETAPERDFLDILHHRVISLFYRSWLKYRYPMQFGLPSRDVLTDYLQWLIGLSPTWSRKEIGLQPLRLVRYAGTLPQHPRSATTLEGLLYDYWAEQYPIRVQQFVGRWVALPPDNLNAIGMVNSRLGVDLTVGEQVYDLSGAFNVTIGPVDWNAYLTFLPDGERFKETQRLIQLFAMDPLSFTIEVVLQPGEVPEMQLTSDDASSRLGFTSWPRVDEMPETSVTFEATIDKPGLAA